MTLTPEQRKLFDALHEDKVQDYKVFSKRDYGRLFSSLIDKYPESAHFVYELLQNAEDANATQVSIILKNDRLIFVHNGTKHFDVTPLDSDKIGDINSITGFGFSSKVADLNNEQEISTQKIGKFGVGFKSVFQYTDTPEIYDDTYCFKIENYIIPTLLDHDNPSRKSGETMFVFRFKEQNIKQAYDHIKRRLENLRSPLLFLRNIKKITWRIDSSTGEVGKDSIYEKRLIETQRYNNITLERYQLIEPQETSSIFLFSKLVEVEDKGRFPIYVGYYYDEQKKQLITDVTRNVYCFFPTKVSFNTCFIAHAPFLLTDNRQDLKPDTDINVTLVCELAGLAAQTLVILRDYGIKQKHLLINENITEICPQYENHYYYDDDETIYEGPFSEAFNNILSDEPLLLSREDKYIFPSKAYTTHKGVFEILEQKQLESLRMGAIEYYSNEAKGVDFLQWQLAQNIQRLDDPCDYFREVRRYDISDFGDDISAKFMSTQTFEWVTKFYTFLREHAAAHVNVSPQSKAPIFRKAPIIKTQNNEWVAPFINYTTPNVYLPLSGNIENSSGYNFVNNQYLNDPIARKFFDQLELKTPDEYDYIRNIILKKYTASNVDIPHNVIVEEFFVLLTYYQKIQHTDKEDDFIDLVQKELLIMGSDEYLHHPFELYFETPELKQYFGENSEAAFFNLMYYRRHNHSFKTSFINDFVLRLGLNTKPRFLSSEKRYSWNIPEDIKELFPDFRKSYYNDVIVRDKFLDGFEDACDNKRITKGISIFLWNEVIGIILSQYVKAYENCIIYASTQRRSTYDHFYRELRFFRQIKQYAWIYNKDGELCKAEQLHIEDLLSEYNLFNGITDFMDIVKAVENLTEKYGATDEEQAIFDFGAKAKAAGDGLTEEEQIAVLAEAAKKKKAAIASQHISEGLQQEQPEEPQSPAPEPQQPKEDIEERLKKKLDEKKNRHIGKPSSPTNPSNTDIFENRNPQNSSTHNDDPFFVGTNEPINTPSTEAEETARAQKNLKAKSTLAQEQAEASGEQVEYLELLNNTQKFTFKWFQILMLLMHQGQDKVTKRTVQIDFAHYELQCSDKILHLSDPNIPVPAWINDAEKYVVSAISDGKSNKIEGLIVKREDNSLDLSVEVNPKMRFFLQQAKKIRVIAEDNTNIIDSLETRFLQLDKEPDFDMNANLPSNISFIYGPPGTGKTTELVRQVHDILEREPKAKILVLTPTNKAADVVAIKMANDEVCEGGLARYGATESLYLIEEIGCVTNRDTTDLTDWHNIVVATAARYAYDYVQPDDTPICDYPWDYIFIDEASMIDILTITYILHKGASTKQLIVSGDPMQIQPVVQNDMPEYNIYDMVNLHGFSDAIFDYDRFKVQGLTMQHRSIPVIGDLVSNFAYDGLVESDPNRAPMKPLQLDGIRIRNINFLGFDVADLDDIKGLNAVNNSAFNLYSVIFTYNMIEYTIKQIEKHYPNKEYTIGVVCAYRAQSDAIKNMLENRPLDTEYCKVSSGTVHSFQGDECDIMYIVLNPPAACTSGTHVNNTNIINVAMSRARDYIFFVMPNGQQKGFFMKNKIGHHLADITERAILKCSDIERVMFQGNDNFIYENTHVTCHMPVNVYCEDNALYEVRMSDNALDIKINQHLIR